MANRKKNKFFWNSSSTLDSIDIYQYTGIPTNPVDHNNWKLDFRYTVDSWHNFEADEFLPYFESDNLELSTPNEVIGYNFSTNSSGEMAMRYEGTFGNSQRVTIYSHFEDPGWIQEEQITKIFDDRNNLIENIESEWRTNAWVDIEKFKDSYTYNNGDIIVIIHQEWVEGDPDYKNVSKIEFLSQSTNNAEELAISKSNFKAYPNPSNGDLNILANEGQIAIYSATGQLVFEKEVSTSSTVINVENLPKGVYFVTWNNKGLTKTNKVVVQ